MSLSLLQLGWRGRWAEDGEGSMRIRRTGSSSESQAGSRGCGGGGEYGRPRGNREVTAVSGRGALDVTAVRVWRPRRGRRTGDRGRALAHHLVDQHVPVAGKRGVGRLLAAVVGQQLVHPVVRVRQQPREHLVHLQHADAPLVAVAHEPVADHPHPGAQPEQERAQVHVVHRVVPELHGPVQLEWLHVGGQRAERVAVHDHVAAVRLQYGHAVTHHRAQPVTGQPDAVAGLVGHQRASGQFVQRAVQDPHRTRTHHHATRLH